MRDSTARHAASVALFRLVLMTVVLVALAFTWADPDLWGHIRFGQDIIRRGLARQDPYSFTSDIPWTNHEWLAEVVMALAWRFGNPGLVALKALLALGSLLLVARALRAARLSPITYDFLLFAAAAGMWPRMYVLRPQAFSVFLFAAMILVLVHAGRGRPRSLWWLPLIFAAWVNLHGGWIVGLGITGLWAVLTAISAKEAKPLRLPLAAAVLGSAGATLLNPYGVGMWRFLMETVAVNRPIIDDWRPLFSTGAGFIVPWAIAVGIATIAVRRRVAPISHVVIALALGVASIRVSRLDVFFALATVMLLGPHVASPAATSLPRLPRAAAVAVCCAVLLTAAGVARAAGRPLTCVSTNLPWMPERQAGAAIARSGIGGRLLTWFDWGEYAIWHFGPALQVSIDGRRETIYSDAYVAHHLRLYVDPVGEREFLDGLHTDYAWLPAWLPLVAELKSRGWTTVYQGPVSTVLSRAHAPKLPAPAALAEPACFPGP